MNEVPDCTNESVDFTVNGTKGSLADKLFNSIFSYDDSNLKGTGVEELEVPQGLTGKKQVGIVAGIS